MEFKATGAFTVDGTVVTSSEGTDTIGSTETIVVTGDPTAQVFTIDDHGGKIIVRTEGGADAVHGNGDGTKVIDDIAGETRITNMMIETVGHVVTLDDVGSVEAYGPPGANPVELNATGFTGVLRVTTLGGDDTITGGFAKDFISAGSGDDELNGAAGNDTLYGGLGKDSFDGGPGVNRCDAKKADPLVKNCDKIIASLPA